MMSELQKIKEAVSEEVLQQMSAGVIVVEAPSGKIILRNRRAQQWREESLSQARATKLEDAGDFEVFHPDGRPYEIEEWPLMRSIREGEEVRAEEFVYPLADGSQLWLRCDSSPIYDEEGRIVAGVLVAHDVTEQKRSEEQLGYYALLQENTEDAFIATDELYIVTAWNRGAEELYGWRADEVLGRSVMEIARMDISDGHLAELHRQLDETDQQRAEVMAYRKDGTPVWVELTNVAVRGEWGRVTGYVGNHRDITERKLAEQELERRTHQQAVVAELGLRALANNGLQSLMDEAVAFVTQTLDVEYAKIVELLPAGEELRLRAGVGWKEGLLGRATEGAGLDSQAGYTLLVSEPVILEDLSTETRFRPSWLVREHGAVSGMSVEIHGQDIPFGVLSAYTREHGAFSEDDVDFLQAVANVLATAIDREKAEERVEEGREAERSRMSRDLHDEALQDIADALVQTQQIRSLSGDPQQTLRLVRLLATLDRIGPQLRGAIYDLRLEGEQTKLFPELLESLVELHRGMAPESDITLEVRDGVLSGPLRETGRELLRILGEALTNVRRHSGASHVRVSVGITEEKLWAEVEDDGRGFDATESFEQALSATGGLGMRGMRERARALGGDLQIESHPEKGTRMRFEMALKKDDEEPEEEVRILLVDDHAAVREALAAAFEREANFEVVGQAASLAEARQMIEASQQVDVAVVDLGLSDGYGGDVIGELRVSNPQAQALVLSASFDRAEVARAVESGAAGVLHKAVHLVEVVDAVRRLRASETLMPLEEVVELLRFAGSKREEEYEARQALAQLTPREKEVLQTLAEGLDTREIAERLNMSVRTERNHMASVMAKLGVHSQLQALVFALRHGVVEIS
jgi:PAS domain S-box-containing protein